MDIGSTAKELNNSGNIAVSSLVHMNLVFLSAAITSQVEYNTEAGHPNFSISHKRKNLNGIWQDSLKIFCFSRPMEAHLLYLSQLTWKHCAICVNTELVVVVVVVYLSHTCYCSF